MNTLTLSELNALPAADFTLTLADIFEHSPWVAERAFAKLPFSDVEALHMAMCASMRSATTQEQLTLIRAHPQLAGRAALRGELTRASTDEQTGAGLDRCSPDEFVRINQLNDAYQARFGFPFILAVRGRDRQQIIDNMAERLERSPGKEFDEALRQIECIALLRLRDRIV